MEKAEKSRRMGGEDGWVEPAAREWRFQRRWMGGASGESVKKKTTGQQEHAETDPKPGKEYEDDHDST